MYVLAMNSQVSALSTNYALTQSVYVLAMNYQVSALSTNYALTQTQYIFVRNVRLQCANHGPDHGCVSLRLSVKSAKCKKK